MNQTRSLEVRRKPFSWRYFRAWLRSVVVWLITPRLFWATVLVVLGSVAAPWVASEFWLRTLGLALQLLGVGTVAWGVRDTRKLFGMQSVSGSMRQWLRDFPGWPRAIVLRPQPVRAEFGVGTPHLQTWRAAKPTDPILAQVAALRQNFEALKTRLDRFQGTVQTTLGEHSTAIADETAQRRREDDAIREKLHRAQAGGLHITMFGLVCLVCGLVLATLSPDLVQWVR